MRYELFTELYKEAEEAESIEEYIMERGWEEWMDEYTEDKESAVVEDVSAVEDVLTKIFNLGKADMRGLRKITGKSMKKFAGMYGIPERTLQDWEYGNNRVPEYTKRMIAYTIFEGGQYE